MFVKTLITEVTYLFSVRLASFRWQELYLGLFTELGNLDVDEGLFLMLPLKDSQTNKREMHNRINLKAEYRCNIQGRTKRSSDEVPVMGVERRG